MGIHKYALLVGKIETASYFLLLPAAIGLYPSVTGVPPVLRVYRHGERRVMTVEEEERSASPPLSASRPLLRPRVRNGKGRMANGDTIDDSQPYDSFPLVFVIIAFLQCFYGFYGYPLIQ